MSQSTSHTHLFAWLGQHDQDGTQPGATSLGPIHAALSKEKFDRLIMLSNYPEKNTEAYRVWLAEQFSDLTVDVVVISSLDSPMDYRGIYQTVERVVNDHVKSYPKAHLCFHSSPGTPAMTVVWILLGKTQYIKARIIRSHYDKTHEENVVLDVDFPFHVSAEFIDRITRTHDDLIMADATLAKEKRASFEQIIHCCDEMNRVIERAIRVAKRNVPVLIEGESGTGKELMAKAIHHASPRRHKNFVAINCGAIPEELFESELFGHKTGAFTGATSDRKGAFREAKGGTLFLDEIGELPKAQQVKLLRAIQEKQVRPVGADKAEKIDVRIICATHRHLYRDVHHGKFREDLFHRIAVGVLKLPALRDREGDLSLIIDHMLEELCDEHDFKTRRKLSPRARQALLLHQWPGNIRELRNTLLRAIVWSRGEVLTKEEIEDAILAPPASEQGVLGRTLEQGFNLDAVLNEVRAHYIERAFLQTHKKKTAAAKLLGINNHQTLTKWMDKLGIMT